MVAYSFQPQFFVPIINGTKRQTIRRQRLGRSRHAVAGGPITLLTGSRFKPVRIGSAVCESSCAIALQFGGWSSSSVTIAARGLAVSVVVRGKGPLDYFASGDGFASWDEMEAFWRSHHNVESGVPWHGVLITWKDFQHHGD